MLSNEEKKAINLLKSYENKLVYEISEKDKKAVKTILNLIEKQSKEIEKYKNVIDNREFTWKQKYEETFEYVKENFINQDKIKAKIEEIEKEKNIPKEMDFKAFYRIKDLKNIEIAVLQSLLEKEFPTTITKEELEERWKE